METLEITLSIINLAKIDIKWQAAVIDSIAVNKAPV